MARRNLIQASAFAALVLTGCQTQPLYNIGKGPVTLSTLVVSGF